MQNNSFSYKPRKRKESAFEAKIKAQFEANGWDFIKTPLGGGFPDRMALRAGHTIFIELKAAGEKMRPLQIEACTKLQEKGFEVFMLEDGKPVPDELFHLKPFDQRPRPLLENVRGIFDAQTLFLETNFKVGDALRFWDHDGARDAHILNLLPDKSCTLIDIEYCSVYRSYYHLLSARKL